MRFFKFSKYSKTIVELTSTTQKATACNLLDCLLCFVLPFLGKFGPKTQIVSLNKLKYAESHGDVHFFSF